MDLKSKRITGIVQIVFWAAMLMLYTKIGGMGMVYAAASLEVLFVTGYLFLGKLPEAIDYMMEQRRKRGLQKDAANVWKAGAIYSIFAMLFTEAGLGAFIYLLTAKTELLYVDRLLALMMLVVPFLTLLQLVRGVIRAELGQTLSAVSELIFVLVTALCTALCSIQLEEYGAKAAKLMQSIGLQHFYVTVGLVPGIIVGALAAGIFLVMAGFVRRNEITIFEEGGTAREGLLGMCFSLARTVLGDTFNFCLRHALLLLLLWLSLDEIAMENYLFGNFYGGLLPVLGIANAFCDMGLISYQKRLYTAYRKKAHELFYRELKTVLCWGMLYAAMFAAFIPALHKSYLAIWDLQNYTAFMKLATACSIPAFLSIFYTVFKSVLKYRSMQNQRVFSELAGVLAGAMAAAAYVKLSGTGASLYIVSLSVQLLVTILLEAWAVSAAVGIHYFSVVLRCGAGVIVTAVLALLLYGIQSMIFTAFGGLATLLICIAVGLILQLLAVMALHIFNKEELESLPFPLVTRILGKIF